MTVRPRRSLSKCQEDRHSNTEKGDGNTTSNGNVVRGTYRRRAAARERGSLSHSPEQQATNQLWSTRGNKTGFIDEAHQFVSWRNMPWLAFLNKERIQEKQGSDDAYFKRSLTKKAIPWCTTIKKLLKTTHEPKLDSPEWVIRFPFSEPAGSTAANLPRAWCPRYQLPDDAASDDATRARVDRAASIETSVTRSIHHLQSYQQTENAPVAAGAHWRASLLHLGCPAGVLNRDVDVALINYASLQRKRLD